MKKPIPKAPRAPLSPLQSPIEKAVADLMKSAGVSQPPNILLVAPKSEVMAALQEAWKASERKEKKEQALFLGRPKPLNFQTTTVGQSIPPGMVQTQMANTSLGAQLEASLWALAEGIEMMKEPSDLEPHLDHLNGATERVRRVHVNSADVLCPCKAVLRFRRCAYIGALAPLGCDEEAFAKEATLITDTRCGLHKGMKSEQ